MSEKVKKDKIEIEQALKRHFVPRALLQFNEWLRERHWLVLLVIMLSWPGEQVIENLVVQSAAVLANFIPFFGQWLAANVLDSVVDTTLLFIGGPLPLACSLELMRRASKRLGIIQDKELEIIDIEEPQPNKNDAR